MLWKPLKRGLPMFEKIEGNALAKEQLHQLLKKKSVPHALLFAGPKGVGKRACALELATALLEEPSHQHPDLHLYTPDSTGGMHSIEAMRRLSDEVYMAPFRAKSKVFIIEDADKMLPTSSNALLKTLEEPALGSYLFLISSMPDALLPTITSRARKISFFLTTKPKVERTPERDLLVKLLSAPLSYAEWGKTVASLEEQEATDQILEEILLWHRDRQLLMQGIPAESLYFSAYLEELRSCSTPQMPLEKLFDAIEKIRFALQQHVKLRSCLEILFCNRIG